MTATEFRAVLARLGSTQTAIARLLGLSDRQARRYAAGASEIPQAVAIVLRLLASGKISAADL